MVSWKVYYPDGTECVFATNQGNIPEEVLKLIAKQEYKNRQERTDGAYYLDSAQVYTGNRPKEIFSWDYKEQKTLSLKSFSKMRRVMIKMRQRVEDIIKKFSKHKNG